MKNVIKLNYHSMVDIITNSSTVIYTYSEGAVDAVKDLINEILLLEGTYKSADDLFYIDTFLSDLDGYTESDLWPEDIDSDNIEDFVDKILTKQIEKPDWLKEIEEDKDNDYYPLATSLYIKAKDKKYSELANKLLRYLYSTNHEAVYNG